MYLALYSLYREDRYDTQRRIQAENWEGTGGDEEGKIRHLFEKVDPGNHAKQILAVFAEQNQKDESQPSDQK